MRSGHAGSTSDQSSSCGTICDPLHVRPLRQGDADDYRGVLALEAQRQQALGVSASDMLGVLLRDVSGP